MNDPSGVSGAKVTMASRGLAVAAALATAWAAASAAAPATQPAATRPTPFRMFEVMSYAGQPPLEQQGIKRVVLVDRGLWARGPTGFDTSEPDEKACRATAWWAARTGAPVVIDIEHWPVDVRSAPEREVRASLEKLARIVDWMHAERPGMKVGLYGTLPIRDYWTPVNRAEGADQKSGREAYERWEAANALVREYLAKRVDYVFPSLYTFYDDPEGWRRYAEANLAEARKCGKPVYPFLWMNYHESNAALANRPIPAEYWRMELEVCRRMADGVVLWGGWGTGRNGQLQRLPWDERAAWWQETLQFMKGR